MQIIKLVCTLLLSVSGMTWGQPRNGAAQVNPAYPIPQDTLLFVQNTQVPAPSGGFDSVPRFSNGTLKVIKNSSVYIDDNGNVQLNGIIKNNNLLSWPSTSGLFGQVLTSDGMGSLIFTNGGGGGGGNVSTAAFFTADNRLVRTDTLSGPTNIQESGITIDDSNNITGINTATATTFIGNLTGSASNNVLKAGDSMTGTLNMLTQNEIRFQDTAGGEYIGLQAPATVPTSYTLALPSTVPTANQIIRANSATPTQLEWFTSGSSIPPTSSEVIYVTKYGNDITGDGSFSAPYASLAKAISVANTLASMANPITISIAAGRYIENNSAGPLTITAAGIAIVGASSVTTIIIPSTPSNNLLLATATTTLSNITLMALAPSTAVGLSLSSGFLTSCINCRFINFQTGVSCTGSGQSYFFNSSLFAGNGTGLSINNCAAECSNCNISGALTLAGPPANTGVSATGANTTLFISGGACGICATGISLANNATAFINVVNFRRNNTDTAQNSASVLNLNACTFSVTNNSSDVNIQASGAGTSLEIIACEFNGNSNLGVPQATCIQVINNANTKINSCSIINYTTALEVGTIADTSSTVAITSGLSIQNCTNDIIQNGSTTLDFNASTASSNKIAINDPTNVHVAFFDLDDNDALTIGSFANVDTNIIQVPIGPTQDININHIATLYGAHGMGFDNPTTDPSNWFVESQDAATFAAITVDRTKTASLMLVSDTGIPYGGTSALRGWTLTKNGSSAELAFSFQNSDPLLLSTTLPYTILQLDGTNNLIQIPTAGTQIVFDGDTNLYRDSANVLKTDDNLIVGTLTPNRVVTTDPVTNELISSTTTNTELGYLSGVTSSIQTQLNDKVSRSGDTMTGTLQLPAGTSAAPSLTFTGSATAGLSASAGALSLNTNGLERINISSGGTVAIKDAANGFTTAGVVHNNASGDLSSSLIVNADVDPAAAIADTKLATISTAGKVANSATTATPLNNINTIVERDATGDFSAGIITASLVGNVTGSASLNVLKAGDTMTGALTIPAGTAAAPSLKFSGSTNTGISAPAANTLSFDTNGSQAMHISSAGIVSIDGFATAGVVHNDASGNLSTSLIVDGDITNATISNAKLATISSSDTSGTIVVRDGFGNFVTNMITIDGTTTNPTDVATKAYVDAAVSLGLVAKTPALVVSTTDITLSGLQTIDGVSLVATNRVLLVGQTNPVENGLWLVQAGAWTRPADFATGTAAGQAYVLITSGSINAGTSWLCNTPTAIIDTDPIMFVQFSLPGQTTAANVGAGSGQVFKNKTGNTLNLRTIAAGTHMTVTNNSDDITLATDATDTNTINTLVSRDGSGNFSAGTITANLTGSASNNVLKTGDSMTGTLNMLTQNEIRFQDAAGGEYVGFQAPATVPTSYTLALPNNVPVIGQTLRAGSVTATNLEWVSEGGSVSPAASKIIYVTKYGNDSTGDGSLDKPYASLAKAISVANTLASSINPIAIQVNPGIYIEDNSAGPLTITANGISIIGEASTSVMIMPSTLSNDLILVTQSTQIAQMTFTTTGGPSTATAITLTGGTFSNMNTIRIINFQTGLICSGSSKSYGLNNCVFIANGTGLVINDTSVTCNNCTVFGSTSLTGPPANQGVTVTGANTNAIFSGGTYALCTTCMNITGNAPVTISAVAFKLNEFDIVQSGGSRMTIEGSTFETTAGASDIDVQISGAGTLAQIIGCEFNGNSLLGVPEAICIQVTNNANANINSCSISSYTTALEVGALADTSSTVLSASSTSIQNCTNDLIQNGSSTLNFSAGSASDEKMIINDSTNVTLAFFDSTSKNTLTIGSLANVNTSLLQVASGIDEGQTIAYNTNVYSTEAIGFENDTINPTSWFVVSPSSTGFSSITTDRTQPSSLMLVSDEGVSFGGTSALRGWTINKNGSSAELAFKYQNSDLIGQVAVPQYTLLQLDGLNNTVQLPTTGTQIIFAGDTNLYRDSANVLKTDDNFIVDTLTPNRVVTTDPVTNELISSVTTNTELGYLSGVTSSIQTQLNDKVSRSGDTMTGTLQLPAGTSALPSLTFTGSTTAGLSANAGALSLNTNGLERMKISSDGTVSINGFTTAGVVHNDATGNLSTSLIVNADVDPAAAIVDTKLATISTAGKVANSATTATSSNTINTIVLRDATGNFDAGTITANLTGTVTGSASLNVLKSGDTMTGTLTHPAGSAAAPSIQFTGSTNTGISAATANTLSFDTNGAERMNINATGTVTINGLTSTGIVHNNASGALSTSLIVNADIDPAAAISDTKLAVIATAGKVANSATTATSSNTINTIVLRDGSGNFATNEITISGTVTNPTDAATKAYVDAAVTGSFVPLAGGTMTGTLVLPAGTAAAPSLQFTGSTNTGISAATANTFSFDTNGVERMNISTTAINTILPLIIKNLICNQAIQVVNPANTGTITVNATTSILVLVVTNGTASVTIALPASPTDGQYLTIINTNTAANRGVTLAYSGGTVANGITSLNSTVAPTATTGGASVTYIFSSTIASWLRVSRG